MMTVILAQQSPYAAAPGGLSRLRWRYDLTAPSEGRIRAIVQHPAVHGSVSCM